LPLEWRITRIEWQCTDKEEDEKKIWILIKSEYGDEKAG
jgi:hypothetical protein